MSKQEILTALKANPEKSINQIAKKLGLDAKLVSEAQLDFCRKHLKRDNLLWGSERTGVLTKIR